MSKWVQPCIRAGLLSAFLSHRDHLPKVPINNCFSGRSLQEETGGKFSHWLLLPVGRDSSHGVCAPSWSCADRPWASPLASAAGRGVGVPAGFSRNPREGA